MNSIISVIMATYNASETIGMAIDSLRAQSYKNWELLIVNDGSTDNSADIIQSFSDDRIKYFIQENKGVSSARNLGLKHMQGDFFCFLDADDVLPERSLEERLKVFNKNENATYVDGSVYIKNDKLTKILTIWTPCFVGNPLNDLVMLGGKTFFGPSWMFKRDREIPYKFDEDLTHGEDLFFNIQQAVKGGLYYFTKEPVLFYRKGNESAMKNLKGLENGYRIMYKKLGDIGGVSNKLQDFFCKRAKNIMLKSYLRSGKPVMAFKTYFGKW